MKNLRIISMVVILIPINAIAQIGWYSPSIITDELNTVFFVDSLNGWVGGGFSDGSGSIKKTTDGGVSWVAQTMPVTSSIHRITFLSQNIGFAVGQTGCILKTTNGGVTWIQKSSGTQVYLESIFFLDSQHGWACGLDTVLFTTNQGETWSARSVTATALWDVCFRTSQEGWVVGLYGDCFKSTNGEIVGLL